MKRQLILTAMGVAAFLMCSVAKAGPDPDDLVLVIAAGESAMLKVPFTDMDCRKSPDCAEDPVQDDYAFSYEWTEEGWTCVYCPDEVEQDGWFWNGPNGDRLEEIPSPATTPEVYWQSPVEEDNENNIIPLQGGDVRFKVHLWQPERTNSTFIDDDYTRYCTVRVVWMSIGEHGNDDLKLIRLNNDDDDDDYIIDRLEGPGDGPTDGEDDLVAIPLEFYPLCNTTSGVIKLWQEKSGSGEVKIWEDEHRTPANEIGTLIGEENALTWDLSDPQVFFNNPTTIYVEGIKTSSSGGDVKLKLKYVKKVGDQSDVTYCDVYDEIKLTVVGADLDVDTLNNSGFTLPPIPGEQTYNEDEENEEEVMEDKEFTQYEEPFIGKCLRVNNGNTDHDCIRDYYDGYDRDGLNSDDDTNPRNQFVPLRLTLDGLTIVDTEINKQARIKFTYEYNRPPMGTDPIDGGTLRIWCNKDADEERDAALDFVEVLNEEDKDKIYFAKDLGFNNSNRTVTFYVEGIDSDTNVDIVIEVDPDYPEQENPEDEGPFEAFLSDKVYVTVLDTNDYVYEAVTGVTPSVGREIPVAGMDVYAETCLHNRQLKITHVNCVVPCMGLNTVISQTYRSGLLGSESLGKCGWFGSWDEYFELVHEYDYAIDAWTYYYIYQGPDGRRDRFDLMNPSAPFVSNIIIPPGYACKVVRMNIEEGEEDIDSLVMYMTDGTQRIFQDKRGGSCTFILTRIVDRFGNAIVYNYDLENYQITEIDDNQGRIYYFTYKDEDPEEDQEPLEKIEFTAGTETYTYTYSYYEGTDILEKIVVSTSGVKDPLTSSAGYVYATEGMIYDCPMLKWVKINNEDFLEATYLPDTFSPYAFVSDMRWGTNNTYVDDYIYLYEFGMDLWTTHIDTNGVMWDYKFDRSFDPLEEMKVFDPTCYKVVTDPDDPENYYYGLKLTTSYDYDEMRLTEVIYPLGNVVGYVYNTPLEGDNFTDMRGADLPIMVTYGPGQRQNPTGGVQYNSTSELSFHIIYNEPYYPVGGGDLCWFLPDYSVTPDGAESVYVDDLGVGLITSVDRLNQSGNWDTTYYGYINPQNPSNGGDRIFKILSPDGSITCYKYFDGLPFCVEGAAKTKAGFYTDDFDDLVYDDCINALDTITSGDCVVTWNTMVDNFGRIEQTVNPMGNILTGEGVTDYFYDAFGRIIEVQAPPLGETGFTREETDYVYHSSFDLLDHTTHHNPVAAGSGTYSPVSSTTYYVYDGLGRLRTVTEPVDDNNASVETEYGYGPSSDQIDWILHPNKACDYFFYDSVGRPIVMVYNCTSPYESYIWDPDDLNGHTLGAGAYAVKPDYNNNNEVIEEKVQYAGETFSSAYTGTLETTYGRDWLGRAALVTEVVTGRTHSNAWNGCGDLWHAETVMFTGTTSDLYYYYHVNGDMEHIWDDLRQQNVEFDVDLQNRTSTVTTPLGEFTDAFDGLGRNISSDTLGVPTERWFNANGNLLRAGHPDYMGTAPSRVYGTRGDLQSVTVPELNDAETQIWSSGRGAPGVVQDPLDITTVNTLNLRGSTNLVTEASGLTDERPTNSWQYIQARKSVVNRDTQKTETAYDLAGRATQTEYYYGTELYPDAVEKVEYDSYGRISKVYPKEDGSTHSDSYLWYSYYADNVSLVNNRRQLSVIWIHTAEGSNILARELKNYNQFGLPTIIKEYNKVDSTPYVVTTTRSYYDSGPAAGQIASETTTINGALFDSYTVSYTYDSLGRRATMTYPGTSGPVLTYGYTDDELLESITKDGSTMLMSNSYHADLRHLQSKTVDGGFINYNYKSNYLGLVSDIQFINAMDAWDIAAFDYNGRGQKSGAGQWQATMTRTYGYDTLARVRTSTNGTSDKFGSESIPQDIFDNRTTITDPVLIDGKILNYINLSGEDNRYESFQDPMGVGGLNGAARLAPYLRVPFTRINFQPDPTYGGPAVPAGFSGDFGLAYDIGRGYGWLVAGVATRNLCVAEITAPDVKVQKRTFALMQIPGEEEMLEYVWEIAVDNDEYFVRVVMGHPDDADDPCYYLRVEGVDTPAAIDNVNPVASDPWVVAEVTVMVSDNKLTLDGLEDGFGWENNRLCYVEFIKADNPVFVAMQEMQVGGCQTLEYDEDGHGNVKSDAHFTYSWDIYNRMTVVADTGLDAQNPDEKPAYVTYLYDGMGRRVAQVYGGPDAPYAGWAPSCTIYDGAMPIAEFDGSGNPLARYYHEGLGRPLRVENSAGNFTLLTDDRGSVVGVTEAGTGQVAEKLHYNMTGLCKAFTGGDAAKTRADGSGYNLGRSEKVPFGYLGMYHDPFTGLYHTHFREYDAVHGRWLSEDPAGYADGLNLYQAYMGVNGRDPLGLRITREELLSAYLKLFGDNPVYRSFFATGGKLEVGDYLRNRSISYSRDNTYTISIEEDIDLATAALHLHGAMNDVLAQSYSMKDEYLGYFEYDPIALGQAYEAVNRAAFSIGAQKVSTLADMYVSAFGIFNEGLDMALSIGEIANGNNMAWLGVLPFAPSVVGKVLRQSDNVWDASKIAFRKTGAGRRILSYSDNAARYMNNGWSWFHYRVHEHHIWFRCLGGSDEAANMLSMQMMIHQGRQVGLHQHILREMGFTTYKGLREGWENAIRGGKKAMKKFKSDIREAYSSYFLSSPDYEEIMEVIDNALKQVK